MRFDDLRQRALPLLSLGLALAGAAACSADTIPMREGAADAGVVEEPAEVAARRAFEETVVPMLDGACAACHVGMAGVDFMAGADRRATILGWPNLIDLASPGDSRMLTKDAHQGPAWTALQKGEIRAWIDLEVLAAGAVGGDDDEVLETPAFAPVEGINTVDLGPVGRVGSSLEFRLEHIPAGWYLSEIQVRGGPGGARLVHPLFVTWADAVPRVDAIDRFSELEVDVAEGATASVGGGLAVLVGVEESSELSIHFLTVEASRGAGPVLAGGCKDVAGFTAMARGPLSQSCASCHAGNNAGATSATDMRGINDMSTAAQTTVCGQILSRVNLTDPTQSGIFIAADPASGVGHSFKFPNAGAFTAYRSALLGWIDQEIN